MAETHEEQDDILLIAGVRAHLLNGEAIELLPFKHPEDVRSEVNHFIEEWAKTGFLLRGQFLYPWNQVRLIEVTDVQALTRAQAQPFLDQWERDAERQRAFWKTRKPQQKKESGDGKSGEK